MPLGISVHWLMTEPRKETILRWFSYQHLPDKLQPTSKIFADMAAAMLVMCPTPSAERTVSLRKLLESKDAFVRAAIEHGERFDTVALPGDSK